MTAAKEIKGWHVALGFVGAFSVIIGVNLTLAFNAVSTFPGLEVKNSYVASQTFDADRNAQHALGWTVTANVTDGVLELRITDKNGAVQPRLEKADLGRATHVGDDQTPDFIYKKGRFIAPVDLAPGNWNLRLRAVAPDGTIFKQRIVLRVAA